MKCSLQPALVDAEQCKSLKLCHNYCDSKTMSEIGIAISDARFRRSV